MGLESKESDSRLALTTHCSAHTSKREFASVHI